MNFKNLLSWSAADFIDWYDNASRITLAADQQTVGGHLAGNNGGRVISLARDRQMFQVLLEGMGHEYLCLTSSGWVYPDKLLKPLFEAARLQIEQLALAEKLKSVDVVDRTKSRPAAPASMPASAPEPEPVPVSPLALVRPRSREQRATIPWQLCDPAEVAGEHERSSDSRERRERRVALKQLMQHPTRRLPLAAKSHLKAIERLRLQFPNFKGVLDLIQNHLALLVVSKQALSLPPLMLLGPPGVGKTFFANTLSDALGFTLEMRSFAETSAAFVITGSHTSWGQSQHGAVAKLLLRTPEGSAPLLMIDEIDKARANQFPPEMALLGLLEPHSAAKFRDEHLDVQMDVRPMSVLMTCNVSPQTDSPLLSRVTLVAVPLPSQAEMPAIVRSVDAELRKSMPGLRKAFLPISEAVVTSLSAIEPRVVRQMLLRAYARAARECLQRESRSRRIELLDTHLEGRETEMARAAVTQRKSRYVIPFVVEAGPFDFVRVH